MCAVYRVFNLSGKRSCGPGQCGPATAGSAQGMITIDKGISDLTKSYWNPTVVHRLCD